MARNLICNPCRKEYWNGRPPHFGSDPHCAFDSGVFSSDNWQCATMNELRRLCTTKERLGDESIGFLQIPESVEEVGGMFLVLTWYKSRGATGGAIIVCDDNKPQELTVDVAEEILAALRA